VGGKAPGAIVADTKKITMLGRFPLLGGLMVLGRDTQQKLSRC
jgi:hypothetical protein